MRTKTLFVILLSSLLCCLSPAHAEYYMGKEPGKIIKTGPAHKIRHSPKIVALPLVPFQRAKGHRPANRDYDMDLATGDDNPYVSPDLQIN